MSKNYQHQITRRQNQQCNRSTKNNHFLHHFDHQFTKLQALSNIGNSSTSSITQKYQPQFQNDCQIEEMTQLRGRKKGNKEQIQNGQEQYINKSIDFLQRQAYQPTFFQDFSFRINKGGYYPISLEQQDSEDTNRKLSSKLNKLQQSNRQLSDQCLLLKKALIMFEREKQFAFDELKKKILSLVTIIERERRSKQKLSNALKSLESEIETYAKVTEKNKSEKQQLSKRCEEDSILIKKLQDEVSVLKEENSILMNQNEDYFNEACEIQGLKMLLEEANKKINKLKISLELSANKNIELEYKIKTQELIFSHMGKACQEKEINFSYHSLSLKHLKTNTQLLSRKNFQPLVGKQLKESIETNIPDINQQSPKNIDIQCYNFTTEHNKQTRSIDITKISQFRLT